MTGYDRGTVAIVGAILVFGVVCLWWGINYGFADNEPPPESTFLRGDGVLTDDALGSLLTMQEWSGGRSVAWSGRPRFVPALIREVVNAGHVGALPDSAELGAVWILTPKAIYVNAGDEWVAVGIGGS